MLTTAVSILERATCCETERQDRLRLSSLSTSTSKPPFPIFPSPSQTSPCCCPPQQRSLRWDNLSRVIRFNSIDHTYSPFPRIPAKEAGGKKKEPSNSEISPYNRSQCRTLISGRVLSVTSAGPRTRSPLSSTPWSLVAPARFRWSPSLRSVGSSVMLTRSLFL